MQHVFVWTLGDVIGLVAVALVLLAVGVVFALEKYERWQWKRRKARGQR